VRRLQTLVVIEFVIIGLLFAVGAWWAGEKFGWGPQEDEETPAATPTEDPDPTMKGRIVEKSIIDKLGAKYDREVVAECPEDVVVTVGTTFECDVWFADDEDVRTVAEVEMTGGGNQFSWTTVNAKDAQPDEVDGAP